MKCIIFAVSCTFLLLAIIFAVPFNILYIFMQNVLLLEPHDQCQIIVSQILEISASFAVCVCICVCFTLIFIYINNVSYRLFKYFPNGTIWMTKALLMHDGRVDYIQMDEQFELFCLWVFFANNEIAIKNRMMIFQLEQYQ